jgi:hypothetical protein
MKFLILLLTIFALISADLLIYNPDIHKSFQFDAPAKSYVASGTYITRSVELLSGTTSFGSLKNVSLAVDKTNLIVGFNDHSFNFKWGINDSFAQSNSFGLYRLEGASYFDLLRAYNRTNANVENPIDSNTGEIDDSRVVQEYFGLICDPTICCTGSEFNSNENAISFQQFRDGTVARWITTQHFTVKFSGVIVAKLIATASYSFTSRTFYDDGVPSSFFSYIPADTSGAVDYATYCSSFYPSWNNFKRSAPITVSDISYIRHLIERYNIDPVVVQRIEDAYAASA